MRKLLLAVMVPVLAAAAAGCGSGVDKAAKRAAVGFERALDSDDGKGACDLLAPRTESELEQSAGKPCSEAILEEDLPAVDATEGSSAFGTMAQVRFAEDTLFVSEFERGWLVMAAGCAPAPGPTYDCAIQGG